MRATLVSSLLGEFVFRMCHGSLFLIVLFAVKKSFQGGERAVRLSLSLLVLSLLMAQKPDGVGIALSFRMHPLHGQ